MAKKTTEPTRPRSRKAASVQPPAVVEARLEAVPASKVPVRNLEEEIRRRAYELYLQRAGTPGNPSQDWLVAEQEVQSRRFFQFLRTVNRLIHGCAQCDETVVAQKKTLMLFSGLSSSIA